MISYEQIFYNFFWLRQLKSFFGSFKNNFFSTVFLDFLQNLNLIWIQDFIPQESILHFFFSPLIFNTHLKLLHLSLFFEQLNFFVFNILLDILKQLSIVFGRLHKESFESFHLLINSLSYILFDFFRHIYLRVIHCLQK